MEAQLQSRSLGPVPPRSTFVTVVAWLFIVGAGYCTLMAILQAAAFTFVFPEAKFWLDPGPPRGIEKLPPLAQFMIGNVKVFFIASWAIFVATFVAAIGLLRRKNWARLYFIALLGLAIAWSVLTLFLQYQFIGSFVEANDKITAESARRFESIHIAMNVFSSLIVVGTCILFGWIAKRLLSSRVRAEFNAP